MLSHSPMNYMATCHLMRASFVHHAPRKCSRKNAVTFLNRKHLSLLHQYLIDLQTTQDTIRAK